VNGLQIYSDFDIGDMSSVPIDARVYKNTADTTFDVYLQVNSYTYVYADVMYFTNGNATLYPEPTWTTSEPTTSGTYTLQLTEGNHGGIKLTSSGNVGIGTTNPEYKLHIEDYTNPRILLENTNSTLSLNQDIASILFKQNDTSLTSTGIIGKIRMSSVVAPPLVNYYGSSANMIFSVGNYATDDANIDALTIRGNGNVGIGTTSPGARLEVLGDSAGQWGNILYLKDSAGSNRLYLKDEQTSPYIPPGLWTGSGGGLSIGSQYEGIMFYTSVSGATPVERMRITSGGNVGIGTDSPGNKLHIQGDSEAITSDPSIDNYGQLEISSSSYAGWGNADRPTNLKIGIDHTTGGLGSAFIQGVIDYIQAGIPLLLCPKGGNVGIGTTNPRQKLDIRSGNIRLHEANSYGDDRYIYTKWEDSSNDHQIGLEFDYYTGSGGTGTTHSRINFVSNATRDVEIDGTGKQTMMSVLSNGNVGIGLDAPLNNFQVRGRGLASTQTAYNNGVCYIESDGTSSSFYTFQVGTGNGRVFGISNTGVAYADGGHGGAQADYAEMFEWLDGNPHAEDRTGLTVALSGEKIYTANEETPESDIIGIVSANPVVLGNNPMLNWHGRWLRDDLNRYQMEEYEAWTWSEEGSTREPRVVDVNDIDESEVPENAVKITTKRRMLNPQYDPTKENEYVARTERPEWSAIGLLGRLRLIKGQRTRSTWYKIRDISGNVEEWFVR
jgi:hypothetical protein